MDESQSPVVQPISNTSVNRQLVSNSTERILKKIAEYSEKKHIEKQANLASLAHATNPLIQEDRKNSFDHVLNQANVSSVIELRK
jgi:hypothetical protein